MRPLISVVVCSYNYGHFIPETLASIINQTYDNWECIVIDDGSTDNTKDIVAGIIKNCSKIRYFFQKNGGLSSAMNAGLKQAQGDFIQFLDADDLISPEKFELHILHFNQDPHVDISYSTAKYFLDGHPEELFNTISLGQKEWMPKLSGAGNTIIQELNRRNIMPVNAPLIRKKSLMRVGQIDEGMQAVMDWDFFLRAAIAGLYFAYLPDERACALIRVHKTSMSQNSEKMTSGTISLRTKLVPLINNCSILSSEEKKQNLKRNQKEIIRFCTRLIVKNGLFNSTILKAIYQFGIQILFLSYIKASRKILSHPINSFGSKQKYNKP